MHRSFNFRSKVWRVKFAAFDVIWSSEFNFLHGHYPWMATLCLTWPISALLDQYLPYMATLCLAWPVSALHGYYLPYMATICLTWPIFTCNAIFCLTWLLFALLDHYLPYLTVDHYLSYLATICLTLSTLHGHYLACIANLCLTWPLSALLVHYLPFLAPIWLICLSAFQSYFYACFQAMSLTWEEKLHNTEQKQEDRRHALEKMGISVQSSGIKVGKGVYRISWRGEGEQWYCLWFCA